MDAHERRSLEQRAAAWALALFVLSALGISTAARAEGDAPHEEAPPPDAPAPADAPAQAARTEVVVLPGIAYDSALGLGLGVLWNISRLRPDRLPYDALVDGQLFLYLGPRPGGGVRVPLQNHWVRLDLPGRADGRLRLRFRVGLRAQINVGYYGVGNAAANLRPWRALDRRADPDGWAAARRRYEYTLIQPIASADALVRLAGPLSATGALRFWWSLPDAPPGSKLADDLAGAAGADAVRLLATPSSHGVLEGAVGLVHDTRDSEIAPTRGGLHELSVRGGPTLLSWGGYGGVHAQTRGFAPLLGERIVVAGRLLVDALFGRPPFTELARLGGLAPEFAPGSPLSVRGLPWQRYHGKIKVIGNVELRTVLVKARLLRRPASAGLIAFLDLGRVWSDWRPLPALDGEALGLKVGVGGGLRIRWGATFVARADVAFSPDGIGAAFDVGHIF